MPLARHTPKLLRCSLARTASSIPFIRSYATQLNTSRRQVTVANDDGRVSWSDLSVREKAARTTQQTFNLGVVVVGAVMTGGVAYLLYDVVFSPDSKISHFNRAFDEVRANSECRQLLGPANQIRAYGESSWNKWTRNRSVAGSIRKDGAGREHLLMHFYVEGPDGKGTVNVHMVRPDASAQFEYKRLSLEVPGHPIIYLRNTDVEKSKKSGGVKFLGFEWTK